MRKSIFTIVMALVLLGGLVYTAMAQGTDLFVANQELRADDSVIIARAVLEDDGWLAIRNLGGQIIGFVGLSAGPHANVIVGVDVNRVTSTLTAQLYEDNGNGTFDPGVDTLVAEMSFQAQLRVEETETPAPTAAPPVVLPPVVTVVVTRPATPVVLPPTGGAVSAVPWVSLVLVGAGALSLATGLGISISRRKG